MATDLTPLYDALRKADAAGDTEGATRLASYIKSQAADPAAPAVSPPQARPAYGASDYAAAAPEAGLTLGTGAIAAPLSGLAGLGTMAGRAMGLTNSDPADVVRRTQEALTYRPRTQGGQDLTNAAAYLPGKFAQGADWAGGKVADVTGSPALGAAVNTGIQGLPLLLGAKLPGTRAGAAASVAPEVADATAAGFKLTPEQAGGGIIGRTTQSLSGSAKLERSLSKQNAPVANQLASQDIGIGGQKLTPANIQAAKSPHNAIYDQVSKLGTVPTDAKYSTDIANISNRTGSGSFNFDVPAGVDRLKTGYGGVQSFDAADAVAKVRQLRADSSKNIKAPNDPEQNALGYSQRQVAEALENQLDRHVQNLSQTPGSGIPPNLVDQLRGARVQLAKIHSVEDAMDGTNISPKALAKQQDRGVPLSGNLKTIANAASNFDRSFQDISKIRDSGPFGVLDLGYGAAAGLAHPGALAAVFARPLARAALASGPYQRAAIQGLKAPPSFPGLLGAPRGLPVLSSGQGGLLGQQQ
jgi:hypothetical protein